MATVEPVSIAFGPHPRGPRAPAPSAQGLPAGRRSRRARRPRPRLAPVSRPDLPRAALAPGGWRRQRGAHTPCGGPGTGAVGEGRRAGPEVAARAGGRRGDRRRVPGARGGLLAGTVLGGAGGR